MLYRSLASALLGTGHVADLVAVHVPQVAPGAVAPAAVLEEHRVRAVVVALGRLPLADGAAPAVVVELAVRVVGPARAQLLCPRVNENDEKRQRTIEGSRSVYHAK